MSEKKVQVEIDGASYTLVTDESEEQIKDIAAYVSSKIAEVKSNKLSYDRELVLASVNIANDLYHVGNRYRNLRDESSEAMENYPGLVENYKKAVAHNDELIEKVDELSNKIKVLEDDNESLNKKIKVNEESEKTIDKLRKEVEKLQRETVTLKSENDQLKGSI
ncbi:MAG: cell division protein ZapA [Anaerococcus sp.]|uniref:cell division protein ZapA n=1 Tax=Anaerococcus octavius TaxID=54007 RepID=UPI002353AF2A|nr:cell division protein ZapA [Anaerococcus octavius]MDU0894822.1 cell division protein ZapA [Anaerococcus sp.]MDU5535655.1 cell division protein ZapA [Anaerococcus sp.]